jgi:hypothetical protein
MWFRNVLTIRILHTNGDRVAMNGVVLKTDEENIMIHWIEATNTRAYILREV